MKNLKNTIAALLALTSLVGGNAPAANTTSVGTEIRAQDVVAGAVLAKSDAVTIPEPPIPAAPEITAVPLPGSVRLQATSGGDAVGGYNAYRSERADGRFEKVPSTVSDGRCVVQADPGKPFYYELRALSLNGKAGPPSKPAVATALPLDVKPIISLNFDDAGAPGFRANKSAIQQLPHLDAYNTREDIGIEFWVKLNSLGDMPVFVCHGSWSDKEGFFIQSVAGRLRFYLAGVGTLDAGTIEVDRWTHIAATYQGSEMAVYVNGKRAGSMPAHGEITPSMRPLYVERYDEAGEHWSVDGCMAGIRLYPFALTDEVIARHYQQQLVATGIPTQTTRPKLYPQLSGPWTAAQPIVTNGQWHCDMCLIQDKLGRWHCIGISQPISSLFHAVGNAVDARYEYLPRIQSDDPKCTDMWAPHAIWKDENTAYLYYAHITNALANTTYEIRLLVSHDPKLEKWEPYKGPEIQGNKVFAECSDRDPCVFYDETEQCYLMYYASTNPIKVRKSKDLLKWSEPIIVIGNMPEPYQCGESPFVIKKGDWYYLFVSGFDYGRISVFASKNPYYFGDSTRDRLYEISGHSPEIVSVGTNDFMACAAINSRIGDKPGVCDLPGVYLQKLQWVDWKEALAASLKAKP